MQYANEGFTEENILASQVTTSARGGFTFNWSYVSNLLFSRRKRQFPIQLDCWVQLVFLPLLLLFPLQAQSASNEGLIAYFPFDGDVQDASGNGNHGIVNGNVSFVPGAVGLGAKFNGVRSVGGSQSPDYIKVSNSASLKLSGAMSVSYWVRIDGNRAQTGQDCSGDAVAGAYGVAFGRSGDRAGHVIMDYEKDTAFIVASGGSLSASNIPSALGTFRHISYTVDAAATTLYVNGVKVKSGPGNSNMTAANTQDIYIGTSMNTGCLRFWYPLDGVVDELRVYNRVLTGSEIAELAISTNVSVAAAQSIRTTAPVATAPPTSNKIGCLIDNGDGTLTDTNSGLIWQACALGQAWSGKSCTGNATQYSWNAAISASVENQFRGERDWILPTTEQSKSLLKSYCQQWTGTFWTSSQYDPTYMSHIVDFDSGGIGSLNRGDHALVRLVRASNGSDIQTFGDSVGALKGSMKMQEKLAEESRQKAEEIQLIRSRCLKAMVPNPNPQPNESTDFYGDCTATHAAQDGIIIWKISGVPVSISCLKSGAHTSESSTESFNSCKKYLRLLPDNCQYADYLGQCKNGVAHGVGFRTGQRGGERVNMGSGVMGAILGAFSPIINYTIYIESGMFADGKLNGHGGSLSVGGCGQAGCSGSRLADVGWFRDGKKILDCAHYSACIPKLSGQDLAIQKRNWKAGTSANSDDRTDASNFESTLKGFETSGSKEDLKRAQALAQSSAQKARLEYALMQAAGFDNVLTLSARVHRGGSSVDVKDAEHLAGFFRSVSSSVPLKISWVIKSNKSLLPLQYGKFAVDVQVGVNVAKTVRSCFGSGCADRVDARPYVKQFQIILDSKNGFTASGLHDLTVDGASTNAFLGAETGSVLSNVTPIISIESVRLIP